MAPWEQSNLHISHHCIRTCCQPMLFQNLSCWLGVGEEFHCFLIGMLGSDKKFLPTLKKILWNMTHFEENFVKYGPFVRNIVKYCTSSENAVISLTAREHSLCPPPLRQCFLASFLFQDGRHYDVKKPRQNSFNILNCGHI